MSGQTRLRPDSHLTTNVCSFIGLRLQLNLVASSWLTYLAAPGISSTPIVTLRHYSLLSAYVCYCRAPVHGFSHTKREVESAFGVPLHQLFDSFDPAPLASGSIAQVHKATLRNSKVKAALAAARHQRQQQLGRWGARLFGRNPGSQAIPDEPIIEVIVKVAHPNVASQIAQDFRLLSGLSAAAARLPVLRGLSLRESVSQFSHTMTAQTDLRVEATHALRFYNNFKGKRWSCDE